MELAWIIFAVLFTVTTETQIDLLECSPPDVPVWGGYGPRQESYLPGDVIHYYCDVDTYIGGNYYRRCEDSGDWTGDTPVCDATTTFSSTAQSSDGDEGSESMLAVDGQRTSCASTKGGKGEEWSGNFTNPGELIRVMLFLPKGPVSFEVVLIKQNGEEIICGSHTINIDRYDWTFQNCPGPHNTDAIGMKIRSLSSDPLKICEIAAHVLVSPKCVDPHLQVENGHMRISRKEATIICKRGYTRSKDTKIQCIRDGVWNRKSLYCQEPQWEVNDDESDSSDGRHPNFEPKQDNPDRERLKL